MERQVTEIELAQMQMKEMQKEIRYLRNRVTKLTDELHDLKEHTNRSIQYLDQASDI